MRFLAIFLSLVCWIDLILHIVIVLNVYQLSAMLPGQAGSFRNQKNAFRNDPKSQKGFWPFSGVQSVYQFLKFNKIIELLSSTVLTGFTGLTSLTV